MNPQMIQEIKERYNAALDKFEKATKWMKSPERTYSEIENFFYEYLKISRELSSYLNQLRDAGIKYSINEVANGFMKLKGRQIKEGEKCLIQNNSRIN